MNIQDPFSYQLNYLKLIGFHLTFKSRVGERIANFYAFFILLIISTGLIGQILYGFEYFERQLLPDLTSTVLGWLTVLIRILVLFANREELNDLIIQLRVMSQNANKFDSDVVKKTIRSSKKWWYLTIFTTLFPLSLLLLKTTIHDISTGHRILPYKFSFFINLEASPTFQVAYGLSCFLPFTLLISLPGTAALFQALCNNIVAHFEILQLVIRNMKVGNERKDIRWIVKHHIEIIRCVRKVNQIYSIMLNQMSIYYSVIICSIGYNIVTADNTPKMIQQIMMLSATIFGVFMYMYAGNKIIVEHGKLARACYESRWTEFPVNIRRDLQLIALRSQRNVVIKTMFFEISLDTFTNIMNAAGSYMTILKSLIR